MRSGEKTFAEIAAPLTRQDLRDLTVEMIDLQRAALDSATNAAITFVPVDPEANDTFAVNAVEVDESWTLGHVIVHTTASSEEASALALTLARGLVVEGRSRVEVPWQSVMTVAQLMQKLAESRRMRLSLLEAWPDQPHLEVTYTPIPQLGPLNAIARFLLGPLHDEPHLNQIGEIMRQARAARAT